MMPSHNVRAVSFADALQTEGHTVSVGWGTVYILVKGIVWRVVGGDARNPSMLQVDIKKEQMLWRE